MEDVLQKVVRCLNTRSGVKQGCELRVIHGFGLKKLFNLLLAIEDFWP